MNDNDFRGVIDGLLNAFQPNVRFMTYRQMRDTCNGFVATLCRITQEENTQLQNEMMTTAAREIMDLIHDKYQFPANDGAVVLLATGMELLKVSDTEYDEKRKQS